MFRLLVSQSAAHRMNSSEAELLKLNTCVKFLFVIVSCSAGDRSRVELTFAGGLVGLFDREKA